MRFREEAIADFTRSWSQRRGIESIVVVPSARNTQEWDGRLRQLTSSNNAIDLESTKMKGKIAEITYGVALVDWYCRDRADGFNSD